MNIRIVSACCLVLASLLCLGAADKTDQSKSTTKKPWPKNPDEFKGSAVDAFTTALTRAGYDRPFRDRLKKSPESARDAVSEVGDIDIPKDILIMFHEPEACENYYAYYLPEPGKHVEKYWTYFQGCLPKFQLFDLPSGKAVPPKGGPKKEWNPENIAEAFTAVLVRSARDPKFREGLTASPGSSATIESAKQAVSDEGNIQIPKEVVILFQEGQFNEKYHVFHLPPFDEAARAKREYRPHFEGFYHVW